MKKLYLIFLLCCFYYVNGQDDHLINIGKIDSINSQVLNEKRNLWIHVPDDNYNGLLKNKKYPVIYLLDGNSHFYSVVGMMKQLSSANRNTICPKMIVVGIPNTNRMRDLSPTKPELKADRSNSYRVSNSGGGDNFISFIEKELIPYIDSNYPTESYRMFIGHSLGGLTVMNTLIHKPELFNSYVAIDPSMWWNNKHLLNTIKKTKFGSRYQNKSLFLGIANTMSKGMDTLNVQKDTTNATRHIRSILELNSLLNKDTQNYLSYKGKYYKEDTHASVPFITEYDALRYIFDFYNFKINDEELMDPESDVLNKIKRHYTRLSREFGRKVKPELHYIDNLAYKLMDMKLYKKAEQFFKLNTINYPNNIYTYNTLGDFYMTMDNKEKAIEVFKKSNSIKKDSYSRDKLVVLQKG